MAEPLAMKHISLKVIVGADAETGAEYNCELAEVVLEDEPGDEERYDVLCPDQSYVTYGPNAPTIQLRGVQKWDALGLATYLWNNVGSEIAFDYAPFGPAPASADAPHWTGVFLANRRPQVGGEVGTFAEIDLEFPIIGAVEMVTTAVLAASASSSRKAAA
jgi:hypothetical protein